jgi:anti-anti-sigma factor
MMFLEHETRGQVVVVTLTIQAIETENARQVTAAVMEAMRGASKVVIDLGSLCYFDISGFAAMLEWTGGRQAGDVRVSSECGAVRALFELLRADSILPLYRSCEEAVASFPKLALRAAADGQPAWRGERPFPRQIAS